MKQQEEFLRQMSYKMLHQADSTYKRYGSHGVGRSTQTKVSEHDRGDWLSTQQVWHEVITHELYEQDLISITTVIQNLHFKVHYSENGAKFRRSGVLEVIEKSVA